LDVIWFFLKLYQAYNGAAVKHMRSFSQWLLTGMSAGHIFHETSAGATVVGCGEMLGIFGWMCGQG
jgi:hypothetical protein